MLMMTESKIKFLKKASSIKDHPLFNHKCISISILTDIVEQISKPTDLDFILNDLNVRQSQKPQNNPLRQSFVSTEFAI